ncbi:MAG: hypothetical protein ACE5GV_14860 [Candidatus Scalindua sp.]
MPLNNVDLQADTFSYVKSSPILSVLEDNNGLFFTGYNGMLTSNSNRGVRDFCLLLVVYIHCFCLPIFSFVINVFSGFGASIGNERSERVCFGCIKNVSFKEDKDFLFKPLFSLREQVAYNLLNRIFISQDREGIAKLLLHGFFVAVFKVVRW